MKLGGAFRLAMLATLVLWVTGVVTVPFSSRTAMEFANIKDFQDFESAMLAYQLENMIYAIGRVPLLFATFVAYGTWIEK